MNKLRKWLCKHDYEQVGFYEEMECGIRYSVRIYQCKKCGNEIHVDGRRDRYAK